MMKAHSAYFVATILGSVWLMGCSDDSSSSGGGAEAGAAGVAGRMAAGSGGDATDGSGGSGAAGSPGMGGSPAAGGAESMAGTAGMAGSSRMGGAAGTAGSPPMGGGAAGTAGSPPMGGAAGMAGSPPMGGAAGMAGSPLMGGGAGAAGTAGAAGGSSRTMFHVQIENVSSSSALPSPFAPGAYAVHATGEPLFTDGSADGGAGLESLAEDGDPSGLVSSLSTDPSVSQADGFDTPVGGAGPAPAFPGESYDFTVEAGPGEMLSFATMLVQSNDLFASTAPTGVALFDSGGTPLSGDITDQLALWDAGTERNEAPGMGPTQAPRQGGPDSGPAEGTVSERVDGTRAIPLPLAMVSVSVSEAGGTYTITLENVSGNGPLVTPISPVFHALHDGSYVAFTPGTTASAGLESLAEDGDPSALAADAASAGATAAGAGSAPAGPGESISFDVTPTSGTPRLSLATMVVQSNDALIATPADGISLLDDMGNPRSAGDVEAEIALRLATWDAGTEANEVPGVGPNQAPRQAAPNTGPADTDSTVRLYADPTNDLDADGIASVLDVTITQATGLTFDVTVVNSSGGSSYPLLITPVAWAVHDDSVSAFSLGSTASAGLESLAEDGDPTTLLGEVGALAGLSDSGAEGATPLGDGEMVSFQVTLSPSNRFLSIWSMVVPSNDTFVSFGPAGVELVDADGNARSDADIAIDVASLLAAFDAGTEANQAGAAGPDMAPAQSGPNTGASEGSAVVRMVDDVWAYPQVTDLLRVVVTPQ